VNYVLMYAGTFALECVSSFYFFFDRIFHSFLDVDVYFGRGLTFPPAVLNSYHCNVGNELTPYAEYDLKFEVCLEEENLLLDPGLPLPVDCQIHPWLAVKSGLLPLSRSSRPCDALSSSFGSASSSNITRYMDGILGNQNACRSRGKPCSLTTTCSPSWPKPVNHTAHELHVADR
jgi:hypothetical protein